MTVIAGADLEPQYGDIANRLLEKYYNFGYM